MSLMSLTAVELGRKIKEKEVTVEEAVTAALDAIEKREAEVHSFVTVDREGALKRAKEVQAKIDAGELTGPLAGVPVAIKDNMCTKGLLTTCSSKILYNFVPTYTAEAVLNLEKAGAVILGKTNMDEFAVEHRACAGRFVGWFLRGGCSGRVQLCARFRHRRLDPSAELLLWRDRHQADLRNGIPVRTDCLRFLPGSDRTDRQGCDRLRDDLRGDRIT